ncbi:hypothetical protein PRIPAC_93745 [Pristionchus pacificus]|uniref:Uncharacterized protein n=1 Tax=Pristionchus pacificus TaxID=54126 RepID=A0A2A6CHZ0_PRIPA|nr:hypothetical protein PRIPAC_93745 [Pristionchus pacificus]|eukprot:PDM77716.1 hypothetical protein PRIPAC_34583 [Pristionchus pacificus]
MQLSSVHRINGFPWYLRFHQRDDNVHRVLQLADRFELKIVEDRVVSYLLSSPVITSFTIVQILLLSEQYNLPFLKDQLLSKDYTNEEHKAICMSDEMTQLSAETLGILYKKAGKQLA